MENEANQANYDELGDHIKLLSKRGHEGKLTPAQIEDLEDYYERALQMRIMQNSTLQEELKSKASENKGLRAQIEHFHAAVLVILVLVAVTTVYLLYLRFPALVRPILVRAYTVLTLPPVLVILTLVGGRKVGPCDCY